MHILFSMPMVIILIALAVISFFFSAAEASHISLNKIRARHLADKGVKGANSVLRLVTKLDRVVAAILIGNNFVNVAISSLVTVMLVSVFGPNWGAALSTFLVTMFILVFCEITPKTIAIRYSEKTALYTAPFLEVFIRAFDSLINFFIGTSNLILRLFGEKPQARSPLITEEELRLMIEIGKEEGVLSDEERKMLHRIFEFGDTKVGSVMVAKERITAIDKNSNPEQLLDILVEEGHARIPVYEGSVDTIVGIIYARDLLYVWKNKGLVVTTDLIHPAYYVSANKRVNELLREFQLKHIQMAIVRDDNQKTLGLVTLEDLIEEIVGEI
ncbi:MAG: hemolysin family protein [Candidatus Omnitrophota bacterium]|nr:hemolysin family protein [Candidatus Omnitrophota bacterium]